MTQNSSANSASEPQPASERWRAAGVPGWLRVLLQLHSERRGVADALLAAAVMLSFGLPVFVAADWSVRFEWLALLPWLALFGALCCRRQHPWLAFALLCLGFVAKLVIGLPPHGMDVAVLIVIYSAAVFGSRALFVLAALAAVVLPVVEACFLAVRPLDAPILHSLANEGVLGPDHLLLDLALIGLPFAVGSATAWVAGAFQRMQLAAASSAQSARLVELEFQRTQEQLIVEQERSEIARDMHDVVAHSLAVVVAQADGGRYLMRTSPQAVEPVLTTIAQTARDALVDVRGLLSQLRHSQTEPERKSLADIPPLIDLIRNAGLQVSAQVHGEPRPIGANAEVAVYRLVQESLTNALKYSDLSQPTQLRMRWAEQLDITVRNRISRTPATTSGSRHGLVGMRERLAVVGGQVRAGAEGDEWVVTASVPYVDRSPIAPSPGLPQRSDPQPWTS